VVRAWRWTFWLILVAFLAGLLRVPASALELIGVLPANGPTWYVLLQAGIGLVQFVIGLAMIGAVILLFIVRTMTGGRCKKLTFMAHIAAPSIPACPCRSPSRRPVPTTNSSVRSRASRSAGKSWRTSSEAARAKR
jgi:hypothetical protein